MPGMRTSMITTFGLAALGERDGARAVGRLADHADVRRTREREAQAFADDLVVVDDQAGDLGGGRQRFEDDIPLYGQRKLLGLRRRAQADACGGRRMPCSRASFETSARSGFRASAPR